MRPQQVIKIPEKFSTYEDSLSKSSVKERHDKLLQHKLNLSSLEARLQKQIKSSKLKCSETPTFFKTFDK